VSWRDTALYISTLTASTFGTTNLYLDFSRFVIGSYSALTPTAVKTRFSVLLAVCIIGLGFSFKKTFETLVEALGEKL